MPKAHIGKVDDVSFEKSLEKHCFDEVKLSNELAYLIFSYEKEEEVQDYAKEYVFWDGVDEKWENSFD